jgi:hypothetical protein
VCTAHPAISRFSSARPLKIECLSITSELSSSTADSINALSKTAQTLPIGPAIAPTRGASVN